MFEEIDTSGEQALKIPTYLAYACVVLLMFFYIQTIRIDIPIIQNAVLFLLIGVGPLCALILGSLFGALRKRRIKIDVTRLEFKEDTRELSEFGAVYYEGDFATEHLGGEVPWACGMFLLIIVAALFNFGLMFICDMNPIIMSRSLFVLVIIFFPLGVHASYRATPIANNLVINPLYHRITKHFDIHDALNVMNNCEHTSRVIIKYRKGIGRDLKVIDDVHAFIITTTEPELEIEVNIADIANIGPDFTLHLPDATLNSKEEIIRVAGHDAMLTFNETGSSSTIELKYMMNRFRVRILLRSSKKVCALLTTLLQYAKEYVPEMRFVDKPSVTEQESD